MRHREEIYDLFESLGAPARLLDHVKLVGTAADEIAAGLARMNVSFDAELMRLGAACHDAGKITYVNELDEPGSLHEAAGERLLLEHGFPATVARFCRSHAQYERMENSYEELLVALADKLWKGKRVAGLELRVIDATAARVGKDRWDVFEELDGLFERVAADGDRRLALTMA